MEARSSQSTFKEVLMFKRARLGCSFCGKSAAEVAKLVAGPRVHICDVCAAEAHRIMSDPSVGTPSQAAPNLWGRIGRWFGGHGSSRGSMRASQPAHALHTS